MEILKKAFGPFETNCYILKKDSKEWIIDPGMGAMEWVVEMCLNPQAILLTHGHYDHIFDVSKLKKKFPLVPVYCPEGDVFMLESDCYHKGIVPCSPDVSVVGNRSIQTFDINGLEIKFHHFPGHTPGCSIIEIEGEIFSGDFIFYRSIGRYDFPDSNPSDMKQSLEIFYHLDFKPGTRIHPGHGRDTTFEEEKRSIFVWKERI